MKAKLLTAAIILWTLLATGRAEAASTPITIAVFDFEAKDSGDLGKNISALLNASLSTDANLVTVERAELNKVLGEQELSLSGTVSAETASKVGHLTGARVLVTGRVFRVGNDNVIVAKIISTETSRVFGEMVKGRGEATELAADLAGKVLKTVSEKSETLVAKTESKEEWMKSLKSKLGDAKRPIVFVRLPEHHYGAPVNDPAAETELMKLLKETGFPVTDAESKAEVVISGEAFSAAAGRKGNLQIAKARVEVKAVSVKDAKILAADRETSVSVDLAEQTAAKTALQKAAETLAVRLLPRLLKQGE